MIPIIFAPDEQSFTSNGLGRLTDCRRFEVTEERNGQYECVFEYPIDGPMFKHLKNGYFVYAAHDDSKTPQPFEIYSMEATLDGWATFRAWHISYWLNDVILKPFTATSCADAMSKIQPNSITQNKFTFWTDKAVTADYALNVPRSVRSTLGGSSGSLLDVYGKGDYEFDKFNVKLWVNRGADRGVSIRYGKNLTKLDQQLQGGSIVNMVVPYWEGPDGDVVSLDYAVYGNAVSYPTPIQTHTLEVIQTHTPEDIYAQFVNLKAQALDLSSDFEDAPTPAELAAKAQQILNASDEYEIKDNIKIDFVALWQTEEYKSVANLQRVYLCDTVHIYYEKLGVNAKAKCIKVVYDTLNERYISVELGEPQTTLGQQVTQQAVSGAVNEVRGIIKGLPDKSYLQDSIDYASDMIRGGLGGHVRLDPQGEDPAELLIMDTADKTTAVNVWRWNAGGLGHSHTGYNGPFSDIAITADGKINATMMTTGTLNANVIAANSIAVSKLTGSIADSGNTWSIDLDTGSLTIGNITANKITSGTLNVGNLTVTGTIQDNLSTPKNYWNLTTGEFVTTQGTLGGFTIDSDGLTASSVVGEMTITPSTILTKTLSLTKNRMAAMSGGQLTLSTQDDNLNWQSCLSLYALALPDNKRNGTIAGPNSNTYINMGETGIVLHLDSSIGGQELNMNPNGISLNSENGYFRINTGTGTFTVNSHQVLEIH